MSTYVGNPALYPGTITLPDDGNPRSAGSMNVPFEALADRTATLKDRLDYLDPNKTGARRLRTFATAAACRADTVHAAGDAAYVTGQGLYFYDASSSATDDGLLVIKPTDVGGGNGRYLHELVNAYNQPLGPAQLASTGKVPAQYLQNGIIKVAFAAPTFVSQTLNQTIVSDTFLVAAGDLIIFSGHLGYGFTSGSPGAFGQVLSRAGSPIFTGSDPTSVSTTVSIDRSGFFVYQEPSAGAITYAYQTNDATGNPKSGGGSGVLIHLRPS